MRYLSRTVSPAMLQRLNKVLTKLNCSLARLSSQSNILNSHTRTHQLLEIPKMKTSVYHQGYCGAPHHQLGTPILPIWGSSHPHKSPTAPGSLPVARKMDVSRPTLYCLHFLQFCERHGIEKRSFTTISDDDLVDVVIEIKKNHPNDGYVLMEGHLQARGLYSSAALACTCYCEVR